MILLAILLNLASVVVTGALIGVLSVQRVHAHIKAVKRLFLVAITAFLAINVLFFIRRFIPFDEALTGLVLRVMFSLTLSAAAAMGAAATILYKKPKSTSRTELYADIVKTMFLPFVSYMTTLFIIFILGWILPISLELRNPPTSETGIYVPLLDSPIVISLSIAFTAFISYPTVVFLLASRAAENMVISHELKMFAVCIAGLALSMILRPFFLYRHFAEAVEIIRIPCLVAITYVFKEVTSLQRFDERELREYMEALRNTTSDE